MKTGELHSNILKPTTVTSIMKHGFKDRTEGNVTDKRLVLHILLLVHVYIMDSNVKFSST